MADTPAIAAISVIRAARRPLGFPESGIALFPLAAIVPAPTDDIKLSHPQREQEAS